MVASPDRFDLDLHDITKIQKELDCTGEAGPGPRRLIRFIAGLPVTKDAFQKKKLKP